MTCMILLFTDSDLYNQRDGHRFTLTVGSNADADTWVISIAGFVTDAWEERRVLVSKSAYFLDIMPMKCGCLYMSLQRKNC